MSNLLFNSPLGAQRKVFPAAIPGVMLVRLSQALAGRVIVVSGDLLAVLLLAMILNAG
jgi:hypothetical protein